MLDRKKELQIRREQLVNEWDNLRETLKNISNNSLAFLEAAYHFRTVLDSYVFLLPSKNKPGAENLPHAIARNIYIDVIDELIKDKPLGLTRKNLTDLEELPFKMDQFSKYSGHFFGEENQISKKYNSTVSVIIILILEGLNELNVKQEDALKEIRNPDKNSLVVPNQFYSFLVAQESKILLPQIKNILDNDQFWSNKARYGITGIKKMKALLANKDLNQLSDAEALHLFIAITNIAKKRTGFYGRIFAIRRHPDTQDFYSALLKAAVSYSSNDPFLSIRQKIENQKMTDQPQPPTPKPK